jgi:hypothetical protein
MKFEDTRMQEDKPLDIAARCQGANTVIGDSLAANKPQRPSHCGRHRLKCRDQAHMDEYKQQWKNLPNSQEKMHRDPGPGVDWSQSSARALVQDVPEDQNGRAPGTTDAVGVSTRPASASFPCQDPNAGNLLHRNQPMKGLGPAGNP